MADPRRWRLGALPLLQTSNPGRESAFPCTLRKELLAGTRERFALASPLWSLVWLAFPVWADNLGLDDCAVGNGCAFENHDNAAANDETEVFAIGFFDVIFVDDLHVAADMGVFIDDRPPDGGV